MGAEPILMSCRNAVVGVRAWKLRDDIQALRWAADHLRRAFSDCNRLGRHDLRARVCRMRNWVAAELARAA